jgi:hypothetical protein
MTDNWLVFEQGRTLGQIGSEEGCILRDEEYKAEARITLEKNGRIAPFSITCGIYGWMFHTRFFSTLPEAEMAYIQMQEAITTIVDLIPNKTDHELEQKSRQVINSISHFVERFP